MVIFQLNILDFLTTDFAVDCVTIKDFDKI